VTGSRPDLRQLSKTISHALRHAPWLYELEPDAEGWVEVESLLAALRQHRRSWRELTKDDLREMMSRADKQRFQLEGGRIRALYGHSFPGGIAATPGDPPPTLYHGTSDGALPAILRSGLKPMSRQFVHLSTDIPTATQVARRKGGQPRILTVDTGAAARDGVRFYRGNAQVWLADEVPARYLSAEAD
jgi:putative RNA 2'-phosphotransferase